MTDVIFFSEIVNSSWTTPYWLIAAGITIGMLVCALLGGIGFALSQVPGLNTINENRYLRLILALAITGLICVILVPTYWIPAYGEWTGTSHHLGAYQPHLEIDNAVANTPGNSALLLSVLLTFTFVFLFCLTFFAMCSRKIMSEVSVIVTEGPMGWLLWIGSYFAFILVIGVVLFYTNGFGTGFSIVNSPLKIFSPVTQISETGVSPVQKYQVEADVDAGTPIDVDFDGAQLHSLEIWTDQRLELQSTPFDDDSIEGFRIRKVNIKLEGGVSAEPVRLMREGIRDEVIPRDQQIETLYVKNDSGETANLEIRTITSPVLRAADFTTHVKELEAIPWCAGITVVFFLTYFFFRGVTPKISAVALSTFKTEVSQPVYLILLIAGSILVLGFVIFPYNTFGEDIKMLKDSGLTLILVFSIFLAIWSASKSVAEEIEGRTALTVLSKPIGRRQFIVGKFLGIAWALAVFSTIVGVAVFLPAISFKAVYDAKETASEMPTWQTCFGEAVKIAPGLLLGYMESLIFVAISVTISTRLPMMSNILICFAIYVLGHLTPLMVQSSDVVQFEGVVFFAQLIAIVLPMLDNFNIQAAITSDSVVPLGYLGWAFVYCAIYGAIALLLGLIFFEDRDVG